jgi:hypothetical protein
MFHLARDQGWEDPGAESAKWCYRRKLDSINGLRLSSAFYITDREHIPHPPTAHIAMLLWPQPRERGRCKQRVNQAIENVFESYTPSLGFPNRVL